jgi:hypothetical protein
MTDYLEIGSSPANEPCVQMGHSMAWDGVAAYREMRTFIRQLRRKFGPEPTGARLTIKTFNFGEYSEVVCRFDSEASPASYEYALRCCNEAPDRWDLPALVELTHEGFDVNAIRRIYEEVQA